MKARPEQFAEENITKLFDLSDAMNKKGYGPDKKLQQVLEATLTRYQEITGTPFNVPDKYKPLLKKE